LKGTPVEIMNHEDTKIMKEKLRALRVLCGYFHLFEDLDGTITNTLVR
jgi:hypothetical protein